MSEDVIRMSVPAKPDYILAVRQVILTVAQRVGFSIDDIEELKAFNDEECAMLLSYGPESMDVSITVKEDGLDMDISVKIPKGCEPQPEKDLRRSLLEKIFDECSLQSQGEIITGACLIKKCN